MARRKSIFSRVWQALKGSGKEKPTPKPAPVKKPPPPKKPAPPRKAAPPPPPREPEQPYVSESDDNERLANRLVRLFIQYKTSYRRGVKESTVHRNVDFMPEAIKEKARRASGSQLIDYASEQTPESAQYPEHFDDDGDNYFWYH